MGSALQFARYFHIYYFILIHIAFLLGRHGKINKASDIHPEEEPGSERAEKPVQSRNSNSDLPVLCVFSSVILDPMREHPTLTSTQFYAPVAFCQKS